MSPLFSLLRPSEKRIRDFLRAQTGATLSYSPPGMLAGPPPAGFTEDRNRSELGAGRAVYEAACDAVRKWRMFRVGWITLWTEDDDPRPGNVVGILVRRLGVWSLNACRILEVVESGTAADASERADGPPRSFHVTYGTLPGHCECGEERFQVEWRADDTVHFEILAYSRPCHPVTRGFRPIIRRFQKEFAGQALEAMRQAVRPM